LALLNSKVKALSDWQIAEAAEEYMKPIKEIASQLDIEDEELLLHGHYVAKVDFKKVLNRLKDKPDGKYIDVTAITPTPWAKANPPPPWAWSRAWASSA
jgi:formyltetrahydrofolate synthetase